MATKQHQTALWHWPKDNTSGNDTMHVACCLLASVIFLQHGIPAIQSSQVSVNRLNIHFKTICTGQRQHNKPRFHACGVLSWSVKKAKHVIATFSKASLNSASSLHMSVTHDGSGGGPPYWTTNNSTSVMPAIPSRQFETLSHEASLAQELFLHELE